MLGLCLANKLFFLSSMNEEFHFAVLNTYFPFPFQM